MRFMVMKRMGPCLSERVADTSNLHLGVQVGVQMMHLLRRLHNAGIYHGDIHAGNVCESRSEPEVFKLIDFGFGGFVEGESFDAGSRGPIRTHASLTEWQLNGYRPSRRDDVYKAVELVAFIAVGHSFWDLPDLWAEMDRPKLIAWKQSGSLFRTDEVDPVGNATNVPMEIQEWMRFTLDDAVDTARHTRGAIRYGKIQSDLSAVCEVLDGRSLITSTMLPTTTITTPAATTKPRKMKRRRASTTSTTRAPASRSEGVPERVATTGRIGNYSQDTGPQSAMPHAPRVSWLWAVSIGWIFRFLGW